MVEWLRQLLTKLLGPAIELDISAPPGLFFVRADPGQLEQVIVNLAVNARDAMEVNGRLVISITNILRRDVAGLGRAIMPAIDFVSIVVSDTGSGIPPDIAAKIFEPFFKTKPQ